MQQIANTKSKLPTKQERHDARDRAILDMAPTIARQCVVAPTDDAGWRVEYDRIVAAVNTAQGRVAGVNAYVTVPKYLRDAVQAAYANLEADAPEQVLPAKVETPAQDSLSRAHFCRKAYHWYRVQNGIGKTDAKPCDDSIPLTKPQQLAAKKQYAELIDGPVPAKVTHEPAAPVTLATKDADTEQAIAALANTVDKLTLVVAELAKRAGLGK